MATDYMAECAHCGKETRHTLFQGPQVKGHAYREVSVCNECLLKSTPAAEPV